MTVLSVEVLHFFEACIASFDEFNKVLVLHLAESPISHSITLAQ